MRSFIEIKKERSQPLIRSAAIVQDELSRAKSALYATEAEIAALKEEIVNIRGERNSIEQPQKALLSEIAFFRQQIEALEKQIQERISKIETLKNVLLQHDGDVQKRKATLKNKEEQIDREKYQLIEKEKCLEAAQRDEMRSRLLAFNEFCSESFDSLVKYSSEKSMRKKWEILREQYEIARTTDKTVMEAHEKRVELQRFVDSANVDSVKDMIRRELSQVEQFLNEKFPGILSMPSDAEPSEVSEAFFWYNQSDDLTYVFPPIPGRFWENVPDDTGDPRGAVLCSLIWGFSEALSPCKPSCDFMEKENCIVFELHGDQREILNNMGVIKITLANLKTLDYLLEELPTDVAEVLWNEDSIN